MARIKCSIVLTGIAFDPSDVSRAVSCAPTSSWKRGDVIEPGTRRRVENGWKLSVEEPGSLALDKVLHKLLQVLEPSETILKALIDRHGLDVEFACAVYVCDGVVPSMHLDLEMIRTIHSYKAELDIDLYSI